MKMIQTPSLTTATTLIIFAAILMVYASISYAGPEDVPDITMSVLESEEGAELKIPEIQLPEKASPVARERAAKGLATANEARQRGQEAGERARLGKSDKPDKKDKPDKPDRPDRDDDDDD